MNLPIRPILSALLRNSAGPGLVVVQVAITLAVLGLNMLDDGLRDSLDPRIRRER